MNYSIEICHLYADEIISDKHLKSIDIANYFIKKYNINNYRLKILIDDFHASYENKNFFKLLFNEINKKNANVDLICFESEFNKLSRLALTFFDKENLKYEKFKKENKKVLFFKKDNYKIPLIIEKENHTKNTCIFLSWIWQMTRLNFFDYPINSIFLKENIEFDKLVNILPVQYKNIEENVKLLHQYTHNKEVINIFY